MEVSVHLMWSWKVDVCMERSCSVLWCLQSVALKQRSNKDVYWQFLLLQMLHCMYHGCCIVLYWFFSFCCELPVNSESKWLLWRVPEDNQRCSIQTLLWHHMHRKQFGRYFRLEKSPKYSGKVTQTLLWHNLFRYRSKSSFFNAHVQIKQAQLLVRFELLWNASKFREYLSFMACAWKQEQVTTNFFIINAFV